LPKKAGLVNYPAYKTMSKLASLEALEMAVHSPKKAAKMLQNMRVRQKL
jgi:hypothetical protein